MRTSPLRTLHLVLMLAIGAGTVRAGDLITAGPMLGHASDTSVSIWYQLADGASSTLELTSPSGGAKISADISDLGRGCKLARVSGLSAASNYEAKLLATMGNISDSVEVRCRTAPAPSPVGTVRLAFGSCSKFAQYKNAPIYRAMAAEHPDFALFVGDNSYFIVNDGGQSSFSTSGPVGDWASPATMFARHMENRTAPDLQDLIHATPCYAVWDDHDYGPNNSDRDFPLKNDALNVFQSVWANPSYGTPETPGVFGSFRFGPVEVFLMDDRFHKHVSAEGQATVPPAEAVIWGEAQLNWLATGLKVSTAPVKLIANGTQVISETTKGEGHFQEAIAERTRLFDFLKANKIGGVVFLSGDRHYSESLRLNQDDGPAILEFTSSPLQQGKPIAPLDRVRHRTQVWGLDGNNYGLVTIDIPNGGKGTIRFEARDEANHVPIIHGLKTVTTTELKELSY